MATDSQQQHIHAETITIIHTTQFMEKQHKKLILTPWRKFGWFRPKNFIGLGELTKYLEFWWVNQSLPNSAENFNQFNWGDVWSFFFIGLE